MFDLPTDTKMARKAYTVFRKQLIKRGFTMLQYSVYARYFGSEEAAEPYRAGLRRILPADGQVRILTVTDKQFGKMEVFFGKRRTSPEGEPEQLILF